MSNIPFFVYILGGIVAAIAVVFVIIKVCYKIAEPNEALIVSGMFASGDQQPGDTKTFQIVSGDGTLVIPGLQTVRSLPLGARTIRVQSEGVTKQAIKVLTTAVVVFKVGDDRQAIANAARRFLDQTDQEIDQSVTDLAQAQLRTIIGSLEVEQLITDRETFAEAVRGAVATEMEKLGLHVDSFQVQDIRDTADAAHLDDQGRGYITNMGRPRSAEMAARARVAEAEQRREAESREQQTAAEIAEATKESQVRQAAAKAETDEATAKAAQAGPLADAQAKQRVIEEATKAAELEASLAEKQLETQVKKPADAKAYEQVTLAEADREQQVKQAQAAAQTRKVTAEANAEAVKLEAAANAEATKAAGTAEAEATEAKGKAQAAATEAQGKAEAAGIEARNKALAQNSDAVIAQSIADKLPEIVRAAAEPLGNIDDLTVFDGADGVTRIIGSTIAQAGAFAPLVKDLLKGSKDTAKAIQAEQPVVPAATEGGDIPVI